MTGKVLGEKFLFESPPLLASGIILAATVVAGWVIQVIFRQVLKAVVGKTKTDFDDKLIELLGKPVFWSVTLGGIFTALLPWRLQAVFFDPSKNLILTVGFVVWGSAGVKIAKLFLSKLENGSNKHQRAELAGLVPFLESLINLLVWGVVFLTALSVWGINITPILASASVIGVAVAFAARDMVANFFGGFSVFFDKPYKLGDYVIINDKYRGEVTEIGIRSTKIKTRDQVLLTVPNSVMVTNAVVNETGFEPELRIRIPLGVGYETDLEEAEKILLGVMKKHPKILDKPQTPRVRYRKFAESSIELELMGMIAKPADRGRVIHQLIKKIDKALKREKIDLPIPQREVHLHKD